MIRDVVSIYGDDFARVVVETEKTFRMAEERNNRTMRVITAGLVATARLLRGEIGLARAWALRGSRTVRPGRGGTPTAVPASERN